MLMVQMVLMCMALAQGYAPFNRHISTSLRAMGDAQLDLDAYTTAGDIHNEASVISVVKGMQVKNLEQ